MATDRQTITDKEMDRPIALSRSRCRERWLIKTVCKIGKQFRSATPGQHGDCRAMHTTFVSESHNVFHSLDALCLYNTV